MGNIKKGGEKKVNKIKAKKRNICRIKQLEGKECERESRKVLIFLLLFFILNIKEE